MKGEARVETPRTDAEFNTRFGPEEDWTPNQKKAANSSRQLEQELQQAKAEIDRINGVLRFQTTLLETSGKELQQAREELAKQKEPHSYCSIHRTFPFTDEPCWQCVNPYTDKLSKWQECARKMAKYIDLHVGSDGAWIELKTSSGKSFTFQPIQEFGQDNHWRATVLEWANDVQKTHFTPQTTESK